jgi:Zn-dependent protease with chaperone function
MASVDFDFQRYVERRRGAKEAQAREGAAYAYPGDLKLLRSLGGLRPVKLALEATERLWRGQARAELLTGAEKASEKNHVIVFKTAARCAERLHVAAPPIYLAALDGTEALGTDDDHYVVVDRGLVDKLTEAELGFVLGRQLGRIQNQHILPATGLYHLTHYAARYVRWLVAPALAALRAWSRRAEITLDRAGLLCARDVDLAASALQKLGAPEERVAALRVFADSEYYLAILGQPGGMTIEACDARVGEILR